MARSNKMTNQESGGYSALLIENLPMGGYLIHKVENRNAGAVQTLLVGFSTIDEALAWLKVHMSSRSSMHDVPWAKA